ncbi:MAG: N-acetyl-D-Glu racemase DgcA [Candidatus Methylumidiphilus sp.]
MRVIRVRQETWPMRGVFRISRGAYADIVVVVVEIREGLAIGRGECRPYLRYGETPQSVIDDIEALIPSLANGMERGELNDSLKPGAARNAIDCALWDLQAKQAGLPAWQLAGLPPPKPLSTAYTLSVDSAVKLAETARNESWRPLLKLKLAGEGDLDRVAAVRANAPQARLIVDANEAWTPDDYQALAPEFARLGVEMLEQPFPAEADHWLASFPRPLPVCADESCHAVASLKDLVGLYDAVNIKLDKTGGMTEALRMKAQAEALGFKLMVGCMVATSLSMAPAFLLAHDAAYVDIDGPLLLARDRDPGMVYQGSQVYPPDAKLWG